MAYAALLQNLADSGCRMGLAGTAVFETNKRIRSVLGRGIWSVHFEMRLRCRAENMVLVSGMELKFRRFTRARNLDSGDLVKARN